MTSTLRAIREVTGMSRCAGLRSMLVSRHSLLLRFHAPCGAADAAPGSGDRVARSAGEPLTLLARADEGQPCGRVNRTYSESADGSPCLSGRGVVRGNLVR